MQCECDVLAGGLRDYTARRVWMMRRMLEEVPASRRLDLEMRIARAEGAQRMCRLLVVRALKAEADLYWPIGLPHGVRAQRKGNTLQYFKINMKSADYPLTIAEWDTQKGRALRAEMLRQPRREPPEKGGRRVKLTSLPVLAYRTPSSTKERTR